MCAQILAYSPWLYRFEIWSSYLKKLFCPFRGSDRSMVFNQIRGELAAVKLDAFEIVTPKKTRKQVQKEA